ncbi:hypothetical protein ILUMI_21245, partial [Ignelater luminosus]
MEAQSKQQGTSLGFSTPLNLSLLGKDVQKSGLNLVTPCVFSASNMAASVTKLYFGELSVNPLLPKISPSGLVRWDLYFSHLPVLSLSSILNRTLLIHWFTDFES